MWLTGIDHDSKKTLVLYVSFVVVVVAVLISHNAVEQQNRRNPPQSINFFKQNDTSGPCNAISLYFVTYLWQLSCCTHWFDIPTHSHLVHIRTSMSFLLSLIHKHVHHLGRQNCKVTMSLIQEKQMDYTMKVSVYIFMFVEFVFCHKSSAWSWE